MSRPKSKRSLWQILGLYAAGSWVVLQVVDVLAENIPLPSWVFMLTLVLLVVGTFFGSGPFDARVLSYLCTSSRPASAIATARKTARPLFMVSSHSLRGTES